MKVRLLLALLIAWPAFASNYGEPTTSTAQTPGLEPLGIFGTVATVTPYFGTLGFEGGDGSYHVRALAGVTGDLYLAEVDAVRATEDYGRILYGVESGILYANVGGNAYAGIVPVLLKGTRRVGPRLWLEGMLGADVVYRSRDTAVSLGRGSPSGNPSTEVFPAIGASLAWKTSAWIALSLRADYVPTPADDLFSATAGFVFPIG